MTNFYRHRKFTKSRKRYDVTAHDGKPSAVFYRHRKFTKSRKRYDVTAHDGKPSSDIDTNPRAREANRKKVSIPSQKLNVVTPCSHFCKSWKAVFAKTV